MWVQYIPQIMPMQKHMFHIQKRFAYYRFHKRVGKGSWVGYIERYKVPRSIENTQRLIYNYEASYCEKKLSCSWLWMLPKKLALSTTSDEVLNVWVYYRHKKKKGYHYLKVLKRLVDVGFCSSSDWRFKLITSRIQNKINTFLNLPRICFYYGKLKATAQLENVTKMLYNRLNSYMPYQLILILRAFSYCHLQDIYLFNKIRDILQPQIQSLPFYYLIKIVESYSSCLIHDYLYLNKIVEEIIYRMNMCNQEFVNNVNGPKYERMNNINRDTFLNNNHIDNSYSQINNNNCSNKIGIASMKSRNIMNSHVVTDNDKIKNKYENNDDYIDDYIDDNADDNADDITDDNTDDDSFYNLPSDDELIKYKQEQFNYYPNIKNIIDVGYYLSNLKFQNYIFYDYISKYIIYMLKEQNCLNPYFIEKVILSFHKIKINDIILYEYILKHIDIYFYDYPPSVLCNISSCLSSVLPLYYSSIYKILKKILLYINKNIDILDLSSLSTLCYFAHKLKINKNLQKDIFYNINKQLKRNDNKNNKSIYDISTIFEILSFHNLLDETSFQILCKHLHRHLESLEPYEFNKIMRALTNVQKHLKLNDEKIVNAIARNVIQQHELFHIIDYHQIAKMLLQSNLVKDIYKQDLIKYHNNLPFYSFDNLEIQHDLNKQVKPKSIYRYQKGTIYFSNKKYEQPYPLHQSLQH
ncbi:hypothetical protein PGSY75_0317900 [Plasmodium gaboni]|uniref:Uncharacterized protein n=1 Tax=Plasmodium gaboni TaxID=647221 RepID=A0A151LVX1_9APIC|nr:hypothetical protein PGSY75_0317900 [Plasmodium gaboni]KYO03292.1 hypothetical protein PGSY75_0317900 [Plasmodium gaboni]